MHKEVLPDRPGEHRRQDEDIDQRQRSREVRRIERGRDGQHAEDCDPHTICPVLGVGDLATEQAGCIRIERAGPALDVVVHANGDLVGNARLPPGMGRQGVGVVDRGRSGE